MFFTKEDFELIQKYGGKRASEYPEAHNLLRKVYNKLGEIAEEMKKYGFYSNIIRNPQNQGQKFETYHWAQLCPPYANDANGKIFFVIDLTEDGFGIHIDCNKKKNLTLNEETSKLQAWEKISVDNVCTIEKQEIIYKVIDYCERHRIEFLSFGNYYNIKSCIKLLNMELYKQLLKNNHNLILTGAPGTGKTYLAKQIAKEMGCSDDEIGFVQFHPSYDYTDFVEGLRPKKGEDPNSIGFEHKNGIFKEFCKNAIESQKTGGQDNFEEAWERLIKLFDSSDQIEINLLSGKNTFFIMLNSNGDGFVNVAKDDNEEWKQKNNGYFNHDQLYRIYKGGKGVNSGALDNYRKAIVKKMIVDCGLKEYKPGENKEKMPPYVFIIDEINRGEISKIFGELFFSIDPGYRGVDENGKPKGLVKTQYQNLVKDGDYFFDGFFVPENVYIIGTMNDIDRSVESMDFAFRRRFAFKEIKASENIGMLDELGDLKEEAIIRMNNLNNTIWDEEKKTGIDGLSSAYHIGGSYFLKLKNYDNNFEDLWNYHIEGLLREYLRGNPEIEKHISELKTAYQNNKKDVSSENNG